VTLNALLRRKKRMRIHKMEGKKERSRGQEAEQEAHEDEMKMKVEEIEQECITKSGEEDGYCECIIHVEYR
jgi:hypothetical protein